MINSSNYVEHVLRTESCDMTKIKERLSDEKTIRLLHAALGVATEAGEFVDVVKKHIFYGKEIDEINAQEEISDEFWYLGLAIDVLKTTMDEVMTKNIKKLKKRYPEKFTEHNALNRDAEKELDHF